jgi:TM2 domain-containing membrane protein YozV
MPKFVCPSCNANVNLDNEFLGKRVRCRCGFVFRAGNKPTKPVKAAPPASHAGLPPRQLSTPPPQAQAPPPQPACPPHLQPAPQTNLINPWQQGPAPYPPQYVYGVPPKSKAAAGLLALFLGNWGAHNFYLGHNGLAAAQLFLTLFGIVTACFVVGFFILAAVSIWTFIEAILCFTGGRLDAEGRMLV